MSSNVPYFKAMAWTQSNGVCMGGEDWESAVFAPWELGEAIAWAAGKNAELVMSGRGTWAMAQVSLHHATGCGQMSWQRYAVLNKATGAVEILYTDDRSAAVAA